VYQPEIDALVAAAASPTRTVSTPRPIAEIIAAARRIAPDGLAPVLYLPPGDLLGGAVVRLVSLQPTRGPRLLDVHVDPASLEVLKIEGRPRPLRPIFELHANLLAGRFGRKAVGWLGVITLGMAVSGLVLWWPRPGGWALAVGVSRSARGRRLCRELHSALGFWSFGVFVLVTFTGVHFVFAQPIRAAVAHVLPVGDGWRAAPLPPLPSHARSMPTARWRPHWRRRPARGCGRWRCPSGPTRATRQTSCPSELRPERPRSRSRSTPATAASLTSATRRGSPSATASLRGRHRSTGASGSDLSTGL
jgi:uncharacterized iron-regulated membrane protein